MSESGHTWQRAFKARPAEAAAVRSWTSGRAMHLDAPLVAHELFVSVLGTQPDAIDMTISTAGRRIRITAEGPIELTPRHTHGPGWQIVSALSLRTGVTPDCCGLWALLRTGL